MSVSICTRAMNTKLVEVLAWTSPIDLHVISLRTAAASTWTILIRMFDPSPPTQTATDRLRRIPLAMPTQAPSPAPIQVTLTEEPALATSRLEQQQKKLNIWIPLSAFRRLHCETFLIRIVRKTRSSRCDLPMWKCQRSPFLFLRSRSNADSPRLARGMQSVANCAQSKSKHKKT